MHDTVYGRCSGPVQNVTYVSGRSKPLSTAIEVSLAKTFGVGTPEFERHLPAAELDKGSYSMAKTPQMTSSSSTAERTQRGRAKKVRLTTNFDETIPHAIRPCTALPATALNAPFG
jgi:hypothetical protein